MVHISLCNSHHLLKLIAHDELQLSHGNAEEERTKRRLDGECLDVKLHQSHACVPVKRLPCLSHPETALATFLNRLDKPTIGAVKGHDGLAVLRKHGCLHTSKHDVGGDGNENDVGESKHVDQDELGNDHVALGVGE